MLQLLYKKETWEKYLAYLESKKEVYQDAKLIKRVMKIIETGEIPSNVEGFPPPKKEILKKYRNSKPRVVYVYPEPYKTYLKVLNWIIVSEPSIQEKFPDNCVAYIPDRSGKQAMREVYHIAKKKIDGMQYYKTDFRDYFNSIPHKGLFPALINFFNNDGEIIGFFMELVKATGDDKGVLAGSPVAGLLANIYMNDWDRLMDEDGNKRAYKYIRYADDVLIIGQHLDTVVYYFELYVNGRGIELNKDKTTMGKLNDGVVFLGVKISPDGIDVGEKAIKKIKSSIKRRAKWFSYQVDKRGWNRERTVKKYIQGVNAKLFTRDGDDGTSWIEWYGSVVSSDAKIKEIEKYYLWYVRYLSKEKEYGKYKDWGYKSIVNEYYKRKK